MTCEGIHMEYTLGLRICLCVISCQGVLNLLCQPSLFLKLERKTRHLSACRAGAVVSGKYYWDDHYYI